MTRDLQGQLFELPATALAAVSPSAAEQALRAQLPDTLWMGAMTWSYPGWAGIVYAQAHGEKLLAQRGLTAYARMPLLRAAEIDRAYYEPLTASVYAAYAAQVPAEFRFLVKAHEDCTVRRFPLHARYGKKRGLDNPRYLDAAYASALIAQMEAGLAHKLGAVLFQFSPEEEREPQRFAQRLHGFLRGLPRHVPVAVELRNAALLTAAYGAALADAGAVHCHNAWTAMPSVLDQARALPKQTRRPLVVRWLLRRGERFADARARYEPFTKIVAEDPDTRADVARLAGLAHAHQVPVLLLVDNKAEGCAPLSIGLLAAQIARGLCAQASSDGH
jgi:uncharacterized protein YecE (DUF72 family)